MTDKTREEISRGEQAALLMQNEIYAESVSSVRQAIIDKWASSPVRDREGQHELKLMLKLLGDLTHYVEDVMQTGKMAKIKLESERRMDRLQEAGL